MINDTINAFNTKGNWYKGNLHSHTTCSDGMHSPEALVKKYEEKGYDFISVTDHNICSIDLLPDYKGILLINGVEFSFKDVVTNKDFHILGLGIKEAFTLPERVIAENVVNLIMARGGEAIICHPYWLCLTLEDIKPLKKCLGMEIYNRTCTGIGRGYSTVHWDDYLTNAGNIWGLAVDDTHGDLTSFDGWIMAKANQCTEDAIMASIRSGHYYSTQGPEIKDMSITEKKLSIECSPVSNIYFICGNYGGRNEEMFRSLQDGLNYVREDYTFTSAEYQITGNEKYIRVEIIDHKGKRAWSNPIFL